MFGLIVRGFVRRHQMKVALILFLLLAACGRQMTESDEAAIANQAESLERAANATTDQLILEIKNDALAEDAASSTPAPTSNDSQP